MELDAKDLQILRTLQLEGRLSNQELAERVNLSPSPCLRRVRLLEENGVITGYGAVVDQKQVGLPITVFIRLRMERHNSETMRVFEERVARIDNILDCWLMTGGSDFLLRVVIESLESYESFVRRMLHTIPGIASIDTSFAYGVIKQQRAFPLTAKPRT